MSLADWVKSLTYVLWPLDSSKPYTKYSENLKARFQNNFQCNPICELWHIAPGLTCWLFISSTLSFVFPIAFAVILSQLISDATVNTLSLNLCIGLMALVITKFLNNKLALWLKIEITHCLCQKLHYLSQAHLNCTVSAEHVRRAIARDFSMVLEGITTTISIISLTFVLLGTTCMVFQYYGGAVAFSLLLLTIYAPLSIFLGYKADKLYDQIMRISADRVENCGRWLIWGPFLNHWHKTKKLSSIREAVQAEMKDRNKDSLYRGTDIYITSFGRVLPYLVMSIYVLFTPMAEVDLLSIFWLAFPLLAFILDYPRIYVSYKNTQRALTQLSTLFITQPLQSENKHINTEIIANNQWQIVGGTLRENLLLSDQFLQSDASRKNITDILQALNLLPELGQCLNTALDYRIDTLGKNLSAGQQARVLLARALCLATTENQTVHINISLTSIDTTNLKNLLSFLRKNNCFKKHALNETIKRELNLRAHHHHIKPAPNHASTTEDKKLSSHHNAANPSENVFTSFARHAGILAILMLLPAATLPILGQMAGHSISLSDTVIMTGLSLAGCFAAIYLGLKIESRVRKSAISRLTSGLSHLRKKEYDDVFQIISRDFLVVNEHISWYAHDLTWSFSLVASLIAILVFAEGLIGIFILPIYLCLYILLWRIFIPHVTQSRYQSVEGINTFLNRIHNIYSIDSSALMLNSESKALYEINRYREKQAQMGISSYFSTYSQMIATKTALANYCQLLSGLFLLTILLAFYYFAVIPPALAMLLTAFLLVDSELIRLFLGISGFKSQVLSSVRLTDFSTQDAQQKLVLNQGKSLLIKQFSTLNANLKYRENKLLWGECYSLTGASGTGKSQYLKTIAGFESSTTSKENELPDNTHFNTSIAQIIYCDQDFFQIMAWEYDFYAPDDNKSQINPDILTSFVNQIVTQKNTLIILDEALSALPLHDAKNTAEEIMTICNANNACLILVDHRFSLKQKIGISQLLTTTQPITIDGHII